MNLFIQLHQSNLFQYNLGTVFLILLILIIFHMNSKIYEFLIQEFQIPYLICNLFELKWTYNNVILIVNYLEELHSINYFL